MAKIKKPLEVTRQRFQLKGKIGKIQEGENFQSFRSGISTKGKMKGTPYRSVNLNIITSLDGKIKNEIPVTLYGMKSNDIYVYNKEEKKTYKKPYEYWKSVNENENFFGVNVGLTTKDEEQKDGTVKSVTEFISYPKYEAIEQMEKILEEGDDVFVSGSIVYSEYLGRDGKAVKKTSLEISRINFVGDIDFHKDDFTEVATWQGEFIFMQAKDMRQELETVVLGRNIISGAGGVKDWVDTNYIIKYGEDKDLKDLSNNIVRSIKMGDKLNLFGDLSCRPLTQQTVPSKLGGKPRASYSGGAPLRLEILGGDNGTEDYPKAEHIAKFYSIEDFVREEDKVQEDSPFARTEEGGLGGKPKTVDTTINEEKDNYEDPFASSGTPIDISDDDLPF